MGISMCLRMRYLVSNPVRGERESKYRNDPMNELSRTLVNVKLVML
jgi:hypothetical protein